MMVRGRSVYVHSLRLAGLAALTDYNYLLSKVVAGNPP